ncbi:polyphosphate kinase [Yersinia massiliensis]|uniref:polyphosphate kinase n=1 Tax=Yersinia massiliensis TaxID=419257 RepID=UPI001CFCB7F2|nr:polyphosphate kinase [Yersinia massiliensis]MCB5307435.1 polyphosphate kinase [Yersinia massiliensis]
MLSKKLEFTRKPDGGLADQIEVLEAMAEGDAYNTELLMLLIELRSLREQREALKKLAPVAEVVSKFGDPEAFGEREIKLLIDLRGVPYGTQLFTVAKPAEIPRHIYSMLVNELRDVPAIGCKRELIIGVLNRHGITAELVQFNPPATE